MQPKKLLPVAAAATMVSQQAHGQVNGEQAFDSSNSSISDLETHYGPMKVIDIQSVPVTWKQYPNIDPEIRKQISNGGLDHTCSGCNETGCLCPDLSPHFAPFTSLCENCRGTNGGGLRCYCSPALKASPCSVVRRHSEGAFVGCDDQVQCNNSAPPVFFCEAAPFYDNPALATLTAASMVYDVRTITVEPGAGYNATQLAHLPQQHEVFRPEPTAPPEPIVTILSQKPEAGKASTNAAGAGVAAAAAGAAFRKRACIPIHYTSLPKNNSKFVGLGKHTSSAQSREVHTRSNDLHFPDDLSIISIIRLCQGLYSTMAAASPHHYKFDITMTCSGCSGAIERVLKKMEGIDKYEVSLESQTADVYAQESLAYETVLEKIKKTGKTITKGVKDGNEVPL
ncbi:MAG: hypothetical protein Q9181_001619 [Wetmoreana brouardii]